MTEGSAHAPSVALPDAPVAAAPRAIRTTLIGLGGNGASQVLRLVSNLLLTRILYPEAFGLMALVLMTLQGLQLVSDVGVLQSIIQHKRAEEPDFLNTAWTVSIIRGAILFVGAALLSWPLAHVYEQPALLTLVPVAAFTALLSGFESTNIALAWRRMHNGRIVLLDLSAQIAALVVNVTVAWWTHSVWALIAGVCTSQLLRTVASHLFFPGRPNRFRLERETVDALVAFGKWVLLSTLITFFASRLDVLLLGKLLSMDALGVYALAGMLASLPATVAATVTGSVAWPILARAHREGPTAMQATHARVRAFLLPALAFFVIGTGVGAPAFFALLYDERYREAQWIAPLLMLPVWFAALHDASTRVLVAMGESRPLVPANAARLVSALAFAAAGYHLSGLAGFIVGNALGAVVAEVFQAVALEKRGLATLRTDLLWTAIVLATGLAFQLGTTSLSRATGWSHVPASIVVGATVLVLFGAATGPRVWRGYRMR